MTPTVIIPQRSEIQEHIHFLVALGKCLLLQCNQWHMVMHIGNACYWIIGIKKHPCQCCCLKLEHFFKNADYFSRFALFLNKSSFNAGVELQKQIMYGSISSNYLVMSFYFFILRSCYELCRPLWIHDWSLSNQYSYCSW